MQKQYVVDLLGDYDTHTAYLYKGWLIINEKGVGFFAFLPEDDEWQDAEPVYSDLEHLQGYYTSEWDGGNLMEMAEFIDCYGKED